MTRAHNPDDICAMCDEWSRKHVEPGIAELGIGRCGVTEPGKPHRNVEWNGRTCVSFRPDRLNLPKRRQYVALQQSKETPP